MLFLLLTILLNTIVFVFFKLFARFGINNLQAIVTNYFVCVLIGCLMTERLPFAKEAVTANWFSWAVMNGCLFIAIFNLIAYVTKKSGLTSSTVANKLSLVIPVLFSYFLYEESFSVTKILGILLAFPAVYFTSKPKEKITGQNNFLLPLFLFVASGLLDTLVKYVEINFLQAVAHQHLYLMHVFAAAFIVGLIVVLILIMLKKIRYSPRSVLAGIVLGIPNYFSIYYLIRLLHSNYLQSSAAIPVNNIGILVLSTLTAIFIFKETANNKRILGLALAVVSILLIIYADLKR